MPALDGDIAAATRDVQLVTWSDAGIEARYPTARDGSVQPATGYFDDPADAQAVIDSRGALIGTERRSFTVMAQDLLWPTPEMGLPQAELVDVEQAVNGNFLAARIELDLETETTTYELFG